MAQTPDEEMVDVVVDGETLHYRGVDESAETRRLAVEPVAVPERLLE